MNVPIPEGSVSETWLETELSNRFPQHGLRRRTPALLVVRKNGVVAANVILRPRRIQVSGTFPTVGAMGVFTVLLIALLPITVAVYFTVFFPKHRAFERRVAAELREAFDPERNSPIQ